LSDLVCIVSWAYLALKDRDLEVDHVPISRRVRPQYFRPGVQLRATAAVASAIIIVVRVNFMFMKMMKKSL
jgi:hypothetical protein